MRKLISSGAPWEKIMGYSRAVKVGPHIFVSGTTAIDKSGNVVFENDFYGQTKFILNKIERSLKRAGAGMKDVVRTRIFTTDISHWEEIGKAHGEFFRHIRPAATMVEVKALIDLGLLVEIEADAVIE